MLGHAKARLVITALVDRQGPAEVAARYEAEGEAGFEPRSRRPRTSPAALAPDLVDLIGRVRKELTDAGLDANPETIAWNLEHHHGHRVSTDVLDE